jgi:drug/metabolite transporter (DMT)-like permease
MKKTDLLCFVSTILYAISALMLSGFHQNFMYATAAFTVACIAFWEYLHALIPRGRISLGKNPIKTHYQKHRTLEEYRDLMHMAYAFLLVLGTVMLVKGLITQMLLCKG